MWPLQILLFQGWKYLGLSRCPWLQLWLLHSTASQGAPACSVLRYTDLYSPSKSRGNLTSPQFSENLSTILPQLNIWNRDIYYPLYLHAMNIGQLYMGEALVLGNPWDIILTGCRNSHPYRGPGSWKGAQFPPSTTVMSSVPARKTPKRSSITRSTQIKELVGLHRASNPGGKWTNFASVLDPLRSYRWCLSPFWMVSL